jgi:hypothetical protein
LTLGRANARFLLGIPFDLFWLTSWIVLTPARLWAAYRTETARHRGVGPKIATPVAN